MKREEQLSTSRILSTLPVSSLTDLCFGFLRKIREEKKKVIRTKKKDACVDNQETKAEEVSLQLTRCGALLRGGLRRRFCCRVHENKKKRSIMKYKRRVRVEEKKKVKKVHLCSRRGVHVCPVAG